MISRAQDSGTVERQCKRQGRDRRQKGIERGHCPFAQGGAGCRGSCSLASAGRHPPLLMQPLRFLCVLHDHFLWNQLSFFSVRSLSEMTFSLSYFGQFHGRWVPCCCELMQLASLPSSQSWGIYSEPHVHWDLHQPLRL